MSEPNEKRVEAATARLVAYSYGPTADADERAECRQLAEEVLAAADAVSAEQAAPSEQMPNGLTEAQTAQTASVRGLGEPSEQALPHLPASQPYVWVWINGEKRFESANSIYFTADQMHAYARAYAAQQPAERVPLTDEQMAKIITEATGWTIPQSSHFYLARAIERAHGISTSEQGEAR